MMPRRGRGRRSQFSSRRSAALHRQRPRFQAPAEKGVAEQPFPMAAIPAAASSQPLLEEEEEPCPSTVCDLLPYLKEEEEEEEDTPKTRACTPNLSTSSQAAAEQARHAEVHEMLSYFKEEEEEEEEEEEVAEIISLSPPVALPLSGTHHGRPAFPPSDLRVRGLHPEGLEWVHFFSPLPRLPVSTPHPKRGCDRDAATGEAALPPIPKKTTSAVWDYFTLDPGEPCVAVCGTCQKRVRRGKDGGTRPGTTALHKHLKVHHGLRLPGVAVVPPSPLVPAKERPRGASAAAAAEPSAPVSPPSRPERPPPYYPPTHPVALQLASDTAWMLAVDMQPLSHVDNEGFRRLMATAQPRWKVPSRTFFATKAVPELSKLVSRAVRQAVACSVGRIVHVAVDTWAGGRAATYMAVTGHWVAERSGALCRQHATLSVCASEGPSRDPEDLAPKLREVLQDWLYDLKIGGVVSRGGGRAAEAVRELRLKLVPCLARGLKRVAEAFLEGDARTARLLRTARRICSRYSCSAAARRRLLDAQARLGLPPPGRLEGHARSNATLAMLERLLRQRAAVGAMLEGEGKAGARLRLAPADWKVAKCLTEILKPFEEATALVTRPDATLGQSLPLLWFLEEQLRALRTRYHQENLNTAAHLATQALGCLEADAELGGTKNSTMYQVAAFLDPRFRDITTMKLGGADASAPAMLKEHLLDLARRSYVPPGPEADFPPAGPSAPPPPQAGAGNPTGSAAWQLTMKRWRAITKSDPATGLATEGGASAATLRELEEYLRDNVDHVGENADPMVYWQGKMGTWPALFKVAVFHFGCPPTSASSEDLAVVASSLAAGDPSRNPSPAHVKMFAFIRKNRHLVPQDWRLSLGDLTSSPCAMGPREDLETEEEEDLLRVDEEPEDD